MQRKPTKNTRGPNADEKRFMQYTKECSCIVCGQIGPSIVDHCLGATFKHNKILLGHWFIIPLCPICDSFKSVPNGSIARFIDMCCLRLCDLWHKHQANYIKDTGIYPPQDVYDAVMDWGR